MIMLIKILETNVLKKDNCSFSMHVKIPKTAYSVEISTESPMFAVPPSD